MDVERLSDGVRNEEGLAQFMADYEIYKNSHSSNLSYPDAMKSKVLL